MSITSERIRALRLQNHLTLDDVAQQIDVNRQAVYKYEHGIVTNIPLEKIEMMARLFGVTPGYLAGWEKAEVEYDLQWFADDPFEKQLLDVYRSLPVGGKQYLLQQAQAASLLFGEKPDTISAGRKLKQKG